MLDSTMSAVYSRRNMEALLPDCLLSGRIDFMDDGLVPYVVPSESRFGGFATRFQRREMTEREFGAYYPETLRSANGVCRRTLWTPAFCDR